MINSSKKLIPSVALFAFAASLLGACGTPTNSSTSNAKSDSSVAGTSSASSSSSNEESSSASSSSSNEESSSASSSSASAYDVPADYAAYTGDEQDISATVTFWETFGSSGTTATTANSYVSAFEKLYPHITINLVAKGGYPDIYSAISTAIPSGTTPTMAICYPDHVASYLDAGTVENMAGYLADPTIGLGVNDLTEAGPLSDFIQSYLPENTNYSDSGVFSMPFTKSTEAMFYNKTMFNAKGWDVPTTWDEMWDLCATIKNDTTIADIDSIIPFGYDSDDNLFITYDQQTNTPYTSLTKPHYLFDNDANKAFVTKLKTMHDANYFLTKGSSSNSTYTSTQFTGGTLFMTVGSTGGTTYNYSDNFETGVAAIPQADTNSPSVISQGPSICLFKRASADEKRAAWLFYKFFTNAKNTALWASLTGYNPVRTSAYSNSIWTDWESNATSGQDLLLKNVADFTQTEYAEKNAYFTSPAFKGSSTARTEAAGIVSSVLLGTKDVDTAFSDAKAACLLIG
jgi:multiple sugar transport system substrate-binding protein